MEGQRNLSRNILWQETNFQKKAIFANPNFRSNKGCYQIKEIELNPTTVVCFFFNYDFDMDQSFFYPSTTIKHIGHFVNNQKLVKPTKVPTQNFTGEVIYRKTIKSILSPLF